MCSHGYESGEQFVSSYAGVCRRTSGSIDLLEPCLIPYRVQWCIAWCGLASLSVHCAWYSILHTRIYLFYLSSVVRGDWAVTSKITITWTQSLQKAESESWERGAELMLLVFCNSAPLCTCMFLCCNPRESLHLLRSLSSLPQIDTSSFANNRNIHAWEVCVYMERALQQI